MSQTEITVRRNASLKISGDFKLLDADGNEFDLGGRSVIAICRCGHTGNDPFCDGSHKNCDFASDAKARTLPKIGK